MNIKFCSSCGYPLERKVLSDFEPARLVCGNCGFVHYENPKIVTGCLIHDDDGKVLLCKRSIEPRLGLWGVPAGFMENGESTQQAAARETLEEAKAVVDVKELFMLASLTQSSQVFMLYRAKLVGGFKPGNETSEVKLFEKHQIPWDSIAFHTVKVSLECFHEDQVRGKFSLHEFVF